MGVGGVCVPDPWRGVCAGVGEKVDVSRREERGKGRETPVGEEARGGTESGALRRGYALHPAVYELKNGKA